jgi:hypothetical protein
MAAGTTFERHLAHMPPVQDRRVLRPDYFIDEYLREEGLVVAGLLIGFFSTAAGVWGFVRIARGRRWAAPA